MADNLDKNPASGNPFESFGAGILEKATHAVWFCAYHYLGENRKHPTFSVDEVYLVWYSKSLKNWKGTFTTAIPDGRYYEVTYNGERQEIYIDVYMKTHNFVVPWPEANNA